MIREEYSFYGPIQEAIYCRDSEVILSGPADTGKTLGLLWKLNAIAEQRKASIVIARKQLTDVYSTVLQTFQNKILGEDRRQWPCTVYGGEKPQWYDYRTGARIWVAGLDKSSKVLSAEHDIIYINQAEEISLTDWETCTTRTTGRAGNLSYGQTIGDCNPGPPTHWIRSRAKSGTLTLFESGHKHNPSLYNPDTGELLPGAEPRISALRSLTGSRLMRLYHGLWAAPEGAIYDVFDEDKHKVASFNIPPLWPKAVGIDPFGAYIAAVWLAFDLKSGIANIYREYREPFGLTVSGHVDNILKLSKGETIFAWVCGAKSERAWRLEFQAAGLPVVEPPITDVWIGIDRVYELLKDFSLVIHDGCHGLLSEIGDYRRKLDKAGNPTDRIENKDAYHCLDALRYLVAFLTQPQEQTVVSYMPQQIGVNW